jgi:hypothetical protein
VREKYCWLIAGGWFVLREKYRWLFIDLLPGKQYYTKKYYTTSRLQGKPSILLAKKSFCVNTVTLTLHPF